MCVFFFGSVVFVCFSIGILLPFFPHHWGWLFASRTFSTGYIPGANVMTWRLPSLFCDSFWCIKSKRFLYLPLLTSALSQQVYESCTNYSLLFTTQVRDPKDTVVFIPRYELVRASFESDFQLSLEIFNLWRGCIVTEQGNVFSTFVYITNWNALCPTSSQLVPVVQCTSM